MLLIKKIEILFYWYIYSININSHNNQLDDSGRRTPLKKRDFATRTIQLVLQLESTTTVSTVSTVPTVPTIVTI